MNTRRISNLPWEQPHEPLAHGSEKGTAHHIRKGQQHKQAHAEQAGQQKPKVRVAVQAGFPARPAGLPLKKLALQHDCDPFLEKNESVAGMINRIL